MKEEIIIAGFGGQGVLSMGKILAYCAIMQDMEVTWMPSYGPEMRGGTANVCVIVSDRKISSPIVTKYDTAIILNQQSLDKFESTVKPGGLLIYDPNGIINPPTRTDIKICKIDAINVAAQVGNAKVYNMAVMGAYLKILISVLVGGLMIPLGSYTSRPPGFTALSNLSSDCWFRMMAVSYFVTIGELIFLSLTITHTLAVPPRISGPYEGIHVTSISCMIAQ